MSPCRSIPKWNITNLVFFSTLLVLTFTALPWYAIQVGFTRADWILFGFFTVLTGLSITVGYHRLFAHRSFEASGLVTFLAIFFGAAAFEQSALMWASQHRDHHRFVDTEMDPYNIKKGFWYAHIKWIVFWTQETDYSNVKDLSANPVIAHQHKYYRLWAISTGILLPLAIGAITGHFWGAFFLGVVGRLTFVHHTTFCINSVCHMFGRATYDIDATAKDHWLVALVTMGEGYHNFHHRFASDYRNGVRWYHWDPSKWVITVLSWCGLAKKLYRTSPSRVLAARAAAEHQRVERALSGQSQRETAPLLETVRRHYAQLKNLLAELEHCEREYRQAAQRFSKKSRIYLRSARWQLKQRRLAFAQARQDWILLINTHPLIPAAARV